MTLSRPQRACIVRENIAKGYGVEDIALMYRMPVDAVRAEVAELREIGAFKHLFSGSKPLQTPAKRYKRNGQGAASTVVLALDHQPLLHQEDNPLIPYMPRGQSAQALRCRHES